MGDTIRLGVLAPSVLLAVARRLGRLDRAGLDVTEVPAASPPAQLRSLLDGRYDAVVTELDAVLTHRYRQPRSNVMIVSAIDRGLGQALYANRPGLRGATIGVDGPDSGSAFTTFALAESLGLSRDDYRVLPLGSPPERLKALRAGECDATLLNDSAGLHAEAAGYRALARVGARPVPYLATVLAAVDPEPVKALAEALTSTAFDICRGTSADRATVEAAGGEAALPFPMAIRYLDLLKSPAEGLVPDGRPDLPAIRTAILLRRRYGAVTTDDPFAAALEPNSGLFQ